jgi:tripartite-type tricarboxylate transporter receptor subunit TctC
MKKWKRINSLTLVIVMVFGCLIVAQVSMAATYPDRPVKLIVGFTPGGPASTLSTMIAKRVSEFLEQPLTVEHRPGASATLAATYVAKAKPDGYTLFTGSDSPLLLAPLITPDVTYTLDDFIQIVGYAGIPQIICVKKGRWNSLKEMIADAKKNPGKYTYSTQGVNSSAHIILKTLFDKAGIDLKMVPYPGMAEASSALLGGHIDLAAFGGTAGLYKAGRIDVLAVAEKKRFRDYPDAPTLAELGYPIFISISYFLCAPKGTPKEIVNKLYAAHQKVFAKYGDELGAMLEKFEMYPAFLSPEEIVDQNKSQMDAFRIAVKNMGIYVPNR